MKEKAMDIKKQFIKVESDIELWVETYGNHQNEACLFISGAGANSSFWSNQLCANLVEEGFFVIKYDHRDIGYSTKLDFEKNPYDVVRLAKDALAILDKFNIRRAHIIGHSMGGFIVQILGIHHTERIISMISTSASTSSSSVPLPPEKTWKVFMKYTPQNNYDKDLEGLMPVWKYLNGTARFDKELATVYTENLYNRQEIVGGLGESHVKAQANLSDRTELLKNVKIPTLIIHGEDDYLVNKYGGIQTAESIENSKLILIPKMGHMPFNREILELFDNEIVRFISEHKSIQT